MSVVYKITKQLCGKPNTSTSNVKDKHGKLLTTERELANRWVEYFKDVLNHHDPDEPANVIPSIELLNIDTSTPTKEEILKAITTLKNRKAPGEDQIHAELLKADTPTATKIFQNLFTDIWEKETIPEDWSKGLIIKLPKKGDLQTCDNWCGITLLSIPSKVFCKVLLQRIETAINTKLREEQAGFRKGRGCIDQIFTLRNIIEQSIEWNHPVYINFIDFRKAFDSIHRETLWRILQSYGIPPKFISIIKKFYDNFECSILLDNNSPSERF